MEKIGYIDDETGGFFDSEEIYNAAVLKAGREATQGEIETFIDRIYDNAIFGCENITLCLKAKLESKV